MKDNYFSSILLIDLSLLSRATRHLYVVFMHKQIQTRAHTHAGASLYLVNMTILFA